VYRRLGGTQGAQKVRWDTGGTGGKVGHRGHRRLGGTQGDTGG